jgi:mono/diheme cytochrome c family protein
MDRRAGIVALLLLVTGAASFGGWAIVTVDDLPEYITVGKPVDLAFTVRQHGVTLMSGLHPTVTLSMGAAEVVVDARPTAATGTYVATLRPPTAGQWAARIESSFGNSRTVLLPVRAIAANTAPPPAMDAVARGEHLFFAKGCVNCHVRGSAGEDGFKFGPVLTGKRWAPGVVAQFLADPTRGPLVNSGGGTMRMPQLNLKEREIASIVSYLNGEERISIRK